MSKIITAAEVSEGEGARVKRLFPTVALRDLDPFVLLDEFFVNPGTGFPEHPHRGFEAITYMLDGSFRHRDNMGNDTTVAKGGVQRFSAGRGLVHAEMPGSNEEVSHGIQLWVNLPRSLKKMEPEYQQVDSQSIPLASAGESIRIRTIVGKGSLVEPHTALWYEHILFDKNGSSATDIPAGWTGLLYIYQGRIEGRGLSAGPGDGIVLRDGENVTYEAAGGTGVISLAGLPHREPIVHHGPFVD